MDLNSPISYNHIIKQGKYEKMKTNKSKVSTSIVIETIWQTQTAGLA
jgi:hypothetical protein